MAVAHREVIRAELLSADQLRGLINAGRALLSELDVDEVIDRVLEAACSVTGARYAAVGVLDPKRERLERFVTRGIDEATRKMIGDLPRGRGVLGALIKDPRPLRLEEVGDDPRSFGFPEHHPAMHSFLGVPIIVRGEAYGNLYLAEKEGGEPFSDADEEAAIVLSGWTAIAVQNARSVEALRLHQSIESSERERRYWARELHDETLQGLAAVRLLLASILRTGSNYESGISEAIAQLNEEIQRLRGLITDLRPDSLDKVGLQAALETLVERMAGREGMDVKLVVALAWELRIESERLDSELETAVYRIVQEALTNAAKHGHAEHVEVKLIEQAREIKLEVVDHGSGFDVAAAVGGFGLTGLRERAGAVGGRVEVSSTPGEGATVRATFPVKRVNSTPD